MKLVEYFAHKENNPLGPGWRRQWHGLSRPPAVDFYQGGDLERFAFCAILEEFGGGHMTMFEVGAGRADWTCALAGLVRFKGIRNPPASYRALAVEAQPEHYEWSKQAIEEQETEPTEEPLEEVTLQEQQEPEEETPAPAMLDPETVTELVSASHLPDAAKAKLSEAEYADEGAVQAAVQAELAYIKEVTGSGKPFAQGAGSAPERRPRTAEEADADFQRILREVGMPYLGG